MEMLTNILSAFCSLIPLMATNSFRGAYAIDSKVLKPASFNFRISDADIPLC